MTENSELESFLHASKRSKVDVKSWSDKGSQSQTLGLSDKPATNTGDTVKQGIKKIPPTDLHPRWHARLRMEKVRVLTLARWLYTKWYHWGLEYHEQRLLEELARRFPYQFLEPTLGSIAYEGDEPEEVERVVAPTRGDTGFETVSRRIRRANQSVIPNINRIGKALMTELWKDQEPGTDPLLACERAALYPLETYWAISKLRSFSQAFNKLFQEFKVEQTGRTGVKKPRQYGYTDGRGSTNDPGRIKMALKADQFFYTQEFELMWSELFDILDSQPEQEAPSEE